MKTNIEVNGYLIEISMEDNNVKVVATKDDEVVNEFTLEEAQDEVQDSDDAQNDEEFIKGEDDFEDSDVEDTEADINLEEIDENLNFLSFEDFNKL